MNNKFKQVSYIIESHDNESDPEKRRRMVIRATALALAIGIPVTAAELILHSREAGSGVKGLVSAARKLGYEIGHHPIKTLQPFATGAAMELAAEPLIQTASNKLEDRYQRKLKEKEDKKKSFS